MERVIVRASDSALSHGTSSPVHQGSAVSKGSLASFAFDTSCTLCCILCSSHAANRTPASRGKNSLKSRVQGTKLERVMAKITVLVCVRRGTGEQCCAAVLISGCWIPVRCWSKSRLIGYSRQATDNGKLQAGGIVHAGHAGHARSRHQQRVCTGEGRVLRFS